MAVSATKLSIFSIVLSVVKAIIINDMVIHTITSSGMMHFFISIVLFSFFQY